ncbi:MAG: type VI secretion system contractile sheath large subunit [Brucella intermedia]
MSIPGYRDYVDQLIRSIDDLVNTQLNLIIHHSRFQKLEAIWRGTHLLTTQSANFSNIKIKVLSSCWEDIAHDFARAPDFDHNTLFDQVYNQELGMPGGEPFGLLIGDYQFGRERLWGDEVVTVLRQIALIAEASFCPFIAGASVSVPKRTCSDPIADFNPSWYDEGRLGKRWAGFRKHKSARFIGLVTPRILLRLPYEAQSKMRNEGYPFSETIDPNGTNLLWGNGAFAFALVVLRAFANTGWFTDIRGVGESGYLRGYLGSSEVAPYDFHLESHGLSAQPPLETRFTHQQEQEIKQHGLIPLVGSYMLDGLVFNTNASLHSCNDYQGTETKQNAEIAGMLQYVLCTSRFAHYIKIIMRQEIGRLVDPEALQRKLQDGLKQYTIGNPHGDHILQRRFPLRSSRVQLREISGQPGDFTCIIHLEPHFQLDGVSTVLHLVANSERLGRNN